jgi:hypothetical protein
MGRSKILSSIGHHAAMDMAINNRIGVIASARTGVGVAVRLTDTVLLCQALLGQAMQFVAM